MTAVVTRLWWCVSFAGAACTNAPPIQAQAGIPTPAHAQAASLEAEARRVLASPDTSRFLHAAALLSQAAAVYRELGSNSAEAEATEQAGQSFAKAGATDSALTYVGRSWALRDAARVRSVATLLDQSPVFDQSRSVQDELHFVREVRALVSSIPALSDTSSIGNLRIRSAEDAMHVLEELSALRTVRVHLSSPIQGLLVSYRRWADRDKPNVAWIPLRTDTAVVVPAVRYQFRYAVSAARDTVVDVPCADGCTLEFPFHRYPQLP